MAGWRLWSAQVPALLLTLSDAVGEKPLDRESVFHEHVLARAAGWALESDVLTRLYYNREAVTGAQVRTWSALHRAAAFMAASELHRMLMLCLLCFLLFITTWLSFSDIELAEDSGIPTEAFLASCYAVVPVLGKIAAGP